MKSGDGAARGICVLIRLLGGGKLLGALFQVAQAYLLQLTSNSHVKLTWLGSQ